MDTNLCFQLLDPITKDFIGWKEKNSESIFVPMEEMVQRFVKKYNALENYDMGLVVILYDKEKEQTDSFAILYAFKKGGITTNVDCLEYKVLETKIDNLEFLEILNNEKERLSQ